LIQTTILEHWTQTNPDWVTAQKKAGTLNQKLREAEDEVLTLTVVEAETLAKNDPVPATMTYQKRLARENRIQEAARERAMAHLIDR
jgi:hypothetical protein